MAFADSQTNCQIIFGEGEAQILLAGTVKKGDCIGNSNGWKRALATVAGVIQMRCVAGEDGTSGQTIIAYFGDCILDGGRFTGATAGGAVYVAEGTGSGEYIQTVPSTTGDATTKVGYALSATRLVLIPNRNTDTIA